VQASETYFPHESRKRSHFGTECRKTSPTRKIREHYGDQEGCRLGLKLAPAMEMVLEGACLVWTSLAAQLTMCI
jgi:hypothetical protein